MAVNSQSKGKRAELDVSRYLTRNGLPARRHVRTGTKDVHDEGDIRLDTAPVTIEVKDWRRGYSHGDVVKLIDKLDSQKRPGDLGLLVCKRATYGNPADWWCWTSGLDASRLLSGDQQGTLAGSAFVIRPVGFTFADVLRLLICDGWTNELVNPYG